MAAFVSEENGRLMLSTAAEPKIFRLGNRNLFQVTTPSSRSFVGVIAALKAWNPKARVALVTKDDPFTRAVAQATRDLVKSAGLTLVLDEAYSASLADFGPVAGKIVSSKADAMLGGGHVADGTALARAHPRAQSRPQVADAGWPLPMRRTSPTSATRHSVSRRPAQWAPQVAYKPDFGPTAQVFARRFQRQVRERADRTRSRWLRRRAHSAQAIEKVGTADLGKVAIALNQMDATTFFGRVRFSTDSKEHGLQIGHEMIFRQWQRKAGRLVPEVIWPVSAKTADALALDEFGRTGGVQFRA
jgi:branched-chain amino acid transport system substrate-binding protein